MGVPTPERGEQFPDLEAALYGQNYDEEGDQKVIQEGGRHG
jgi:hypothetical protein